MTGSESNSNSSLGRRVTVREAAKRLRLSERTVYRRLRSGKLDLAELSALSVTESTDIKAVSRPVVIGISDPVMNLSVTNDNVSDGYSPLEKIRDLESDLRNKDLQIALLIESQRELNQTVQRIQEQMFELARLVLLQGSAKSAASATAVSQADMQTTAENRSFLSRLFGARDKKMKRKP